MKSLNELIARMANREDDCKGRFWEGRFKAQRLCSQAAILSCSVYVDLNPIRAKAATTPETSHFTSAYERIREYRRNPKKESALWITPISNTTTRRGFLDISLPDYLKLLDSTGRVLRHNKRGAIAADLAPILERIGIKSSHWIDIATKFRHWFADIAGTGSDLQQAANNLEQAWCKGVNIARSAYF